jgi:hypothetical protein
MWYGSTAVLSLLRKGVQGAREKNSVVENKEALIFNTSARQRVCRGKNVAGSFEKKSHANGAV